MSATTTPQQSSRVRSQTLPSAVQLSSTELCRPSTAAAEFDGSLQQSRSLSFTNFLSRMSPKSIRRLFSVSHAAAGGKSSKDCSGSVHNHHHRTRSTPTASTDAAASQPPLLSDVNVAHTRRRKAANCRRRYASGSVVAGRRTTSRPACQRQPDVPSRWIRRPSCAVQMAADAGCRSSAMRLSDSSLSRCASSNSQTMSTFVCRSVSTSRRHQS